MNSRLWMYIAKRLRFSAKVLNFYKISDEPEICCYNGHIWEVNKNEEKYGTGGDRITVDSAGCSGWWGYHAGETLYTYGNDFG